MEESSPTDLPSQWRQLYSETLPSLARARDPAQPKWPVTLDHCFARIILDNTIGEGLEQWDKRLKKPAIKNMSDEQLQDAIELGEMIRGGAVDLVALDLQSLETRGKGQQKYGLKKPAEDAAFSRCALSPAPARQKRKQVGDECSLNVVPPDAKRSKNAASNIDKHQSILPFKSSLLERELSSPALFESLPDYSSILEKIAHHPSLTPYRKSLYSALLSVPPGRYTTYAALSDYLRSSARAVGSGMRNNPFAPEVPCHRVLAADGSVGGFHGDWGKDGKYANQKMELLRSEGVKFDSRGKVVGQPFREFRDLRQEG